MIRIYSENEIITPFFDIKIPNYRNEMEG